MPSACTCARPRRGEQRARSGGGSVSGAARAAASRGAYVHRKRQDALGPTCDLGARSTMAQEPQQLGHPSAAVGLANVRVACGGSADDRVRPGRAMSHAISATASAALIATLFRTPFTSGVPGSGRGLAVPGPPVNNCCRPLAFVDGRSLQMHRVAHGRTQDATTLAASTDARAQACVACMMAAQN